MVLIESQNPAVTPLPVLLRDIVVQPDLVALSRADARSFPPTASRRARWDSR